MPSFEDMKNHDASILVGDQIRNMSIMGINETFTNGTSYRKGMIYDCNLNEIEPIEFNFTKTSTYTISKDQVEYQVQFRPGVVPEILYENYFEKKKYPDKVFDNKHRLNYYLDILDQNTGEIDKWLILGKDISEFDKYIVLKCNWTFEWICNNNVYHSCLGVVRDRNNYNSGVWSDGTTTTVENQSAFFVPTNEKTRDIDYGIRFMITDNPIHPKVYEVTKVMDTFPLGATKITLAQSHYNIHTDLCKSIDLTDNNIPDIDDSKMHYICDYYKSSILPSEEKDENKEAVSWTLDKNKVNDKLYIKGQSQKIIALPNVESPLDNCEWHLFVDNEEYEYDQTMGNYPDLADYINVHIDNDEHTFTIAAINKDLAKYILKVAIYDNLKSYYDFVEMEVVI